MPNLPKLNDSGSRPYQSSARPSDEGDHQSSGRPYRGRTADGWCPSHGSETQMMLPLSECSETRAERLARILAGNVGDAGATARTFTSGEAERAARLAASVSGVCLASELAAPRSVPPRQAPPGSAGTAIGRKIPIVRPYAPGTIP